MCLAKTKALISSAVTAQLICIFVSTHADCWFSGVEAHILKATVYFGIMYQESELGVDIFLLLDTLRVKASVLGVTYWYQLSLLQQFQM